MYEYIKGTVEYTGPEFVVIENNDIGYQILTPNPYVFSSKKGIQTIIYTYQHVREDIIALYGFPTVEEKLLFRKLIGVSGIGPKGALAILAFGEPSQVIRAIENEDEKFLVKFPGVGKKTARQMILDLKGKLHDVLGDEEQHLPKENIKSISSDKVIGESLEEALLALSALGYSDRELKKIAPKLQDKEMTTDQYIKQALQMLMM
ncbi:Holliday junction branch migration protein RuvA [Bacillus sp. FJAT-49732]|uniref:Holliday junction branch migration complex subunit RuvA n=1 Tax=Lederbergia citrisecunda TaxID=2833583 RepID=A0A942TLV8_9BACI|nr:Holliday junction branch migration protein RuvA [Lederbergia citrisecunda]MBS4199793.1 Holliday junction branch migration protein RuvA [Lederbergia citrisecunda]